LFERQTTKRAVLPEEALDFRFFATEAMRFVPVELCGVDAAVGELDLAIPFRFRQRPLP